MIADSLKKMSPWFLRRIMELGQCRSRVFDRQSKESWTGDRCEFLNMEHRLTVDLLAFSHHATDGGQREGFVLGCAQKFVLPVHNNLLYLSMCTCNVEREREREGERERERHKRIAHAVHECT